MRKLLLSLALICAAAPAWAQATHTDNTAWGFNTERMGPIGCAIDDTASRTGTENFAIVVRCTALGAVHSNLRNNAGTEIGTAAAPLRIDPTGTTTQPVSAASLPLPAGAATLAEQQTQTASLSVLDDWDETDRAKVNPIAGQAGVQGGSGTVTALTQRMVLATDQPTVPVSAASLPLPTGAATLAEQQTQTASLSVLDDWDETDRAKVNLVAGQAGITAGAGAVAANTPRVTHASDDPVTTAVQIIDDWDETDRAKVNPIAGQAGVQGNTGTVTALTQRMVLATDVGLPAGTSNIGDVDVALFPDNEPFNVAQINGVTPLMGNGATGTGSPRVTIANDNTPVPTFVRPTTSGGTTNFSALSAASTNATNVKASGGQVYGLQVFNTNANEAYLKLYNSASAPTCGSGTPVKRLVIPGNAAGAGFIALSDLGWAFSSGIGFCITTGPADADTGAVAANEVIVNVDFN